MDGAEGEGQATAEVEQKQWTTTHNVGQHNGAQKISSPNMPVI